MLSLWYESAAHNKVLGINTIFIQGNTMCRNQVAKLIKEAGESDLSHLICENREGRIQLLCLKPNEVNSIVNTIAHC